MGGPAPLAAYSKNSDVFSFVSCLCVVKGLQWRRPLALTAQYCPNVEAPL